MKIIDDSLVNTLYAEAGSNQRKRSHYLLHNSHNDKVQRLLIALTKDSFVEPHYHELPHQWELFFILEGTVELTVFDDNLLQEEIIILNNDTGVYSIELPPRKVHSLRCISDTALLVEIKEGPFNPDYAKKLI
ncbi:TPA: WbuC family cupin fold metalloprotein [Morganella morganii]|uniref:WbuC family cupin fold metalloprotein n=1 Tax=Morganella morganii TaxID=582 RepID=UPI001BD97732|nr:WbuC family cupin fold metalloprotein [Morganella morganii]MBT0382259.1 cupin fold metalloprotein, WbuC family [Morganella morganii subsp. morganii]HDU8610224.1 WbuC family cupin fold metalloprotein [Morganella morganii]